VALVHCKRQPYDVYIGRGCDPRTGERGEWGNRYSSRPSRVPGVIVVGSVEEAVALHKRELWDLIRRGRMPLQRLVALHGKTLGCWCEPPKPCHGHNLEAAAMWALTEQARRLSRRAAELSGRSQAGF
jgi:hypothetical protein